jgi:hypothetical protein
MLDMSPSTDVYSVMNIVVTSTLPKRQTAALWISVMYGCGATPLPVRYPTDVEESPDEEGSNVLRQLRELGQRNVLLIGRLPVDCISSWPNLVTDEVVVTGERRSHYLLRHPGIAIDERRLPRTILDPDCVHANANDPRIAILYQAIDGDHYLRVPIWLSDRNDRQNSVLSLRRARRKEVEKGIAQGRQRWQR